MKQCQTAYKTINTKRILEISLFMFSISVIHKDQNYITKHQKSGSIVMNNSETRPAKCSITGNTDVLTIYIYLVHVQSPDQYSYFSYYYFVFLRENVYSRIAVLAQKKLCKYIIVNNGTHCLPTLLPSSLQEKF